MDITKDAAHLFNYIFGSSFENVDSLLGWMISSSSVKNEDKSYLLFNGYSPKDFISFLCQNVRSQLQHASIHNENVQVQKTKKLKLLIKIYSHVLLHKLAPLCPELQMLIRGLKSEKVTPQQESDDTIITHASSAFFVCKVLEKIKPIVLHLTPSITKALAENQVYFKPPFLVNPCPEYSTSLTRNSSNHFATIPLNLSKLMMAIPTLTALVHCQSQVMKTLWILTLLELRLHYKGTKEQAMYLFFSF